MITGWITNKGKVIECKAYDHFCVEDEDLLNLWDDYIRGIESALDMCTSLSEAGEHPEWHHYEMTQDDGKRDAYNDAYNMGYLRISPWNRRGEQPMIAVEGLSKFIDAHKSVLKQLCDKYECRLKIYKRDETN